MSDLGLIVKYQHFRGSLSTWENLFAEAAEFATGRVPVEDGCPR